MRKFIVAAVIAALLPRFAAAESAYSLSLGADIPVSIAAVGAFALPFAIDPVIGPQAGLETIGSIDQALMFPHDPAMNDVSSAMAYAMLVAPSSILLFIAPEWKDALTYAAMYGEAFLLTYGLKDILKDLVSRYRPYTYFGPIPYGEEGDYYNSMPSGHTALAFMGATFLMTTLLGEGVDPAWAWGLGLGGYGLASAVAVLRVASGNHFLSDVLAGAALGSAIGWGIPALHGIAAGKLGSGMELSAEGGFGLRISY